MLNRHFCLNKNYRNISNSLLLNTNVNNRFFSTYIDFGKMRTNHNRKTRRAKTTYMKYPCIPVWNKERFKDPFDYPLRCKKEIAFEQYMNPPLFNLTIIQNDFGAISEMTSLNVHKKDNRNNEIRIEFDINQINLTPLQRRRMIFLLGQRYKPGSSKVKIVSRKYTNFDHNLNKGLDIFRQIYWEAKRAPLCIWNLAKNRERRRIARAIFGKQTPEQMKKLKIDAEEDVLKKKDLFSDVYDNGDYNYEFIKENVQNYIDTFSKDGKGLSEEQIKKKEEEIKKKMQDILTKGSLEKELVKNRILTKKAYDTFFKQELVENEKDQV